MAIVVGKEIATRSFSKTFADVSASSEQPSMSVEDGAAKCECGTSS